MTSHANDQRCLTGQMVFGPLDMRSPDAGGSGSTVHPQKKGLEDGNSFFSLVDFWHERRFLLFFFFFSFFTPTSIIPCCGKDCNFPKCYKGN